jgi:hypothetical protein
VCHYCCLHTVIQVKRLSPDQYKATPSGDTFVNSTVRRGVLPVILDELLAARKVPAYTHSYILMMNISALTTASNSIAATVAVAVFVADSCEHSWLVYAAAHTVVALELSLLSIRC